MPTEIDYARLAMAIDGEGAIYIKPVYAKSGMYSQLCVSVSNCDPRLIMWCKDTFGFGAVHRNKHRSRGQQHDAYSWRVYSATAELILTQCLPYFIIKREQAEVALAYRKTFSRSNSNGNLSGAAKTEREWATQELRRLQANPPGAVQAQ
jgi:hypothetical protein